MDFHVIADNIKYLMFGLRLTFSLSVIVICLAFIIGCPLGVARLARNPIVRYGAILYIELMRCTPAIMVIFWFFFFLPRVTQIALSATVSGTIALIAYYASHMAEITRAGVQAVPKSQVEAAFALGLRYVYVMTYVVLPQALRHMTPALISRFIAIVMATSLLSILGVVEFFEAADIVNSRVISSFTIYTFVAVVYFCLCYGLSQLGRWCERKLDSGSFTEAELALGR